MMKVVEAALCRVERRVLVLSSEGQRRSSSRQESQVEAVVDQKGRQKVQVPVNGREEEATERRRPDLRPIEGVS